MSLIGELLKLLKYADENDVAVLASLTAEQDDVEHGKRIFFSDRKVPETNKTTKIGLEIGALR